MATLESSPPSRVLPRSPFYYPTTHVAPPPSSDSVDPWYTDPTRIISFDPLAYTSFGPDLRPHPWRDLCLPSAMATPSPHASPPLLALSSPFSQPQPSRPCSPLCLSCLSGASFALAGPLAGDPDPIPGCLGPIPTVNLVPWTRSRYPAA